MQTVAAGRFGRQDRAGLTRFLRYCRECAEREASPRIASISRRVPDLDPLAVLQSIHEDRHPHLYMEKRPVSVSGAEAVVAEVSDDPDRFGRVRAFIRRWSPRIIATGDLDGGFSGPLFFTAFPFSESVQPAYAVFVPRWQVCRSDSECIAVANVRVDADMDIEAEAERIWRAHQTFSSFDYREVSTRRAGDAALQVSAEADERFRERVRAALDSIRAGEVGKVVLARWTDLTASERFFPLDTLNGLRESYPDCFAFSFSHGDGSSWIGATPERLARVRHNRFQTEAIAGSAPRGDSFADDTAIGRSLLGSGKDLREHQFVVEAIGKRLRGLGLEPEAAKHPQLLKLSNVQHLRTPIGGNLTGETSLLHLAEALHPTPAVGGVPRKEALALLEQLEPFARGLYTGFLGWQKPDGEGELVVALRTARIEGNQARLYAGAGIVEGSDPERELRETEIKLAAMVSGLS